MTERYLAIREVAQLIGVTPLTLRNWDKKGVFVAYRNPVNNYRMYRYADVADLLTEIETRKTQNQTPVQKLRVTLIDEKYNSLNQIDAPVIEERPDEWAV